MNIHTQNLKKQQGVMLIEALISILIFSIGILALIGLQAVSVSMSTDAKYRSDASLLANEMIGEMWNKAASSVANSAPNAAFIAAEFDSFISPTGSDFIAWQNGVKSTLPNATATVTRNTTISPTVPATGVVQTTSTDVSVTIFWQPPGASAQNAYRVSTQISAQKTIK